MEIRASPLCRVDGNSTPLARYPESRCAACLIPVETKISFRSYLLGSATTNEPVILTFPV